MHEQDLAAEVQGQLEGTSIYLVGMMGRWGTRHSTHLCHHDGNIVLNRNLTRIMAYAPSASQHLQEIS